MLVTIYVQLFLEERVRSGDLGRLWQVAVQTDLTFNLVRFAIRSHVASRCNDCNPAYSPVTPTLTNSSTGSSSAFI